MDVFDYLNISALVDNRICCIHGGLSPEINTVDQIRTIDRATEPPHQGGFCDLLWSDPDDVETWQLSPRGAGLLFGNVPAEEFCHINDLLLICRGHQMVHEGFKFWFRFKNVVTIWSAANFNLRCENLGSAMIVDDDLQTQFITFEGKEKSIPRYRIYPYLQTVNR